MRKLLFLIVGTLIMASLCACGVSLPQGESGSMAMMPMFDAERGVTGIVPAGCQQIQVGTWICEDLIQGGPILLSQQALPVPLDELIEDLLHDTDIKAPPKSYDTIKVKGLEWRLFTFDAHIADVAEVMPGLLHIDMALAERDGVIYMVGVVAESDDYAANARLCEALFSHLVYSLRPWGKEGNDG